MAIYFLGCVSRTMSASFGPTADLTRKDETESMAIRTPACCRNAELGDGSHDELAGISVPKLHARLRCARDHLFFGCQATPVTGWPIGLSGAHAPRSASA